jgi:hypothetical protein
MSDQWQPIETAPKDGKPILGFSTEGASRVCWHRNGSWIFFRNHKGDEWAFHPTHWMSLPALPIPE